MGESGRSNRSRLFLTACAVSAGVAIVLVVSAAPARGGSDTVLVLPLARALALVTEERASPNARPDTASRFRALIPKRIHIPDLYRIDDERDPPRFAEPVDNDKMVALELVPAAPIHPSVSFRFDKESLPLGDSSNRLSVEFGFDF